MKKIIIILSLLIAGTAWGEDWNPQRFLVLEGKNNVVPRIFYTGWEDECASVEFGINKNKSLNIYRIEFSFVGVSTWTAWAPVGDKIFNTLNDAKKAKKEYEQIYRRSYEQCRKEVAWGKLPRRKVE